MKQYLPRRLVCNNVIQAKRLWHHIGHSGKTNNRFLYLLWLKGRALMDSYLWGVLQLSIRGHSVQSTETIARVCTHTHTV